MTQIVKESLPTFHAGQRTVGTAEVPLSPVNVPIAKSVTIKAGANNNWIKVGPRHRAGSNGFPLLAGEQVEIHVSETDAIGIVAGGANQSYSFILS